MTGKVDVLHKDPVKALIEETGVELAFEYDESHLPEMTDKQKEIFKLKLRGLSQSAIAKVLGITQQMVSKHWLANKKKFQKMGEQMNQPALVGESVSLYNEVGERAWDLYYAARKAGKLGDANRALATVMTAKDKQLSLLMDLGLLRRAAVEHEHRVVESPLVKKWREQEGTVQEVVAEVIETQLDQLEEPEPPMLPDIIDGEVLEEPVPPGEED